MGPVRREREDEAMHPGSFIHTRTDPHDFADERVPVGEGVRMYPIG